MTIDPYSIPKECPESCTGNHSWIREFKDSTDRWNLVRAWEIEHGTHLSWKNRARCTECAKIADISVLPNQKCRERGWHVYVEDVRFDSETWHPYTTSSPRVIERRARCIECGDLAAPEALQEQKDRRDREEREEREKRRKLYPDSFGDSHTGF